jgi:hypothetical protein
VCCARGKTLSHQRGGTRAFCIAVGQSAGGRGNRNQMRSRALRRQVASRHNCLLREQSALWVPNRSSMSCDVGIFVDQPTEQVAVSQVQG